MDGVFFGDGNMWKKISMVEHDGDGASVIEVTMALNTAHGVIVRTTTTATQGTTAMMVESSVFVPGERVQKFGTSGNRWGFSARG